MKKKLPKFHHIKAKQQNLFCRTFKHLFTDLHKKGVVFFKLNFLILDQHPVESDIEELIYFLNIALTENIDFLDFSLTIPIKKKIVYELEVIIGVRFIKKKQFINFLSIFNTVNFTPYCLDFNSIIKLDSSSEIEKVFINKDYGYNFYNYTIFSECNAFYHYKYKDLFIKNRLTEIFYTYHRNCFLGQHSHIRGKYFQDFFGDIHPVKSDPKKRQNNNTKKS
jgi:hypothetical protein